AILCRQPVAGDWAGAIATVRASLLPYLAQRLDGQAQQVWRQGDKAGAFARWRAAVQLDPNAAYLRFNWGLALQKIENRWGAIALYRDAWQRTPSPETAGNLGGMLLEMGYPQAALDLYHQALTQFPQSEMLHRHLAGFHLGRMEPMAAETHARQAIALAPTAAAWSLLGSALGQQQRIEEAQAAFDQALNLDPHHLEAQLNLGSVYQEQKDLTSAIAAFRRGIDLATQQPNTGPLLAQAHFHLATTLLAVGQYREGWEAYEWRWQLPGMSPLPAPLWQGEPVDRLAVWGEQGFGDVLQFVRFVPQVRSRCRELYLVCRPPLQSLLQDSLADIGVTVLSEPASLPAVTAHIPLLSLPRLLQTNLNTLPADVPYVRVAIAAHPLPPAPLRFGLVWQSGAHSVTAFAQEKSCGWERLAPLVAALPHIRFYSLQVGAAAPPSLPDLAAHCQDFRDTAAYLQQLDGLITVDTAVAHLAGALAKPTWVLLPYAADWRWGVDGSDSPWYRTLRLVRQPRRGDWETPIQEAISQLRGIYGRTGGHPPDADPTERSEK
ncbi:MAG: tetratricopeptide repeat-containing glycosyltransferase family protein, partial [Pseudanabaenaceae cyanobacterium]